MGLEPEERSANPQGSRHRRADALPVRPTPRWILTELLPALVGLGVGAASPYGGATARRGRDPRPDRQRDHRRGHLVRDTRCAAPPCPQAAGRVTADRGSTRGAADGVGDLDARASLDDCPATGEKSSGEASLSGRGHLDVGVTSAKPTVLRPGAPLSSEYWWSRCCPGPSTAPRALTTPELRRLVAARGAGRSTPSDHVATRASGALDLHRVADHGASSPGS